MDWLFFLSAWVKLTAGIRVKKAIAYQNENQHENQHENQAVLNALIHQP